MRCRRAPATRLVAAARLRRRTLLPVFETHLRGHATRIGPEYHLCEDLVDLETQFQLWRFRHMRTVMRIIGFKRGTGGSVGVGFLKQALELTFFPELFDVRTVRRQLPWLCRAANLIRRMSCAAASAGRPSGV